MKLIDKLLFGLLLGFSFPALFFLIALILWYSLFQDFNVLSFVLSGFIIGLFIDALILKKLINRTLDLSTWILTGFYLFYNVCIYGAFMGFPVFNLVMGIIAGYYFGIKINNRNISLKKVEALKKNVPLFSGLTMLLFCISTGFLALTEKTIGEELQKMFGLGFDVTRNMIIAIVIVGGIALIFTQFYLTRIVMIKTIRKNN